MIIRYTGFYALTSGAGTQVPELTQQMFDAKNMTSDEMANIFVCDLVRLDTTASKNR